MVLVVDHLVSDGISMQVMRRDFEDLLAGLVREKAGSLADFVRHEQEHLVSPAGASDVEFWHRMWADFGDDRVSLADLPFYIKSDPGDVAVEHLLLDADWTRRFGGLVRTLRVTPHCLFLSALLLVLSAYLKRARVAIWNHFANRDSAPFSEIVAMMQITHLIGFEIDPHLSFEQFAKYVSGRLIDAIPHQQTPLTQVFSRLGWRPLQACARPLARWVCCRWSNRWCRLLSSLRGSCGCRDSLANGEVAQAAAALAAISRATTSSSIDLARRGGDLVVTVIRAGFNGIQAIESVIDQAGNKQVVQKAYDMAGSLVHYDPK